jgi:hypothetical protein
MTKVVVANNARRTSVHPESVGYGFYQLLFLETPLQFILPRTYRIAERFSQYDFDAETDYID